MALIWVSFVLLSLLLAYGHGLLIDLMIPLKDPDDYD